MRILRIIPFVGACIALIGLLLAVLMGNRGLGIAVFKGGFFVGAIGAVAFVLALPKVSDSGIRLTGLKIGAIGFGVVAFLHLITSLGTTLPSMIEESSWVVGAGMIVVGALFQVSQLLRRD